ncbi:thymidylate kinase [Mariprofundus ferrinatatus]|uniref:Thymidylate kinase n=1 Tax=Mariprofundus ferrinatatus TaxID=1921087 RepID=A0A2K8L8A0_9PROT|nr:dTMP kinase [Mariprofundus ferrinatatus]ATX82091.1 thymidylate kinase [Mariprofundus ferrinatatus]
MNRLITFEGVDGCGKSTQLALAAKALKSQGEKVVTTFEPGDTPMGKKIRKLLLSGKYVPVPEAELLLFLADRAQHVCEVIQPALASGAWVLCDRYSDSTLAYQLAARKLGSRTVNIREMLTFAECRVAPAMTLWFDLPVDVAAERMKKRMAAGEKSTRLDDEALSFHQRVSAAFASQFEADASRIVRIDASHDIEAVRIQVETALNSRFSIFS